MPPGNIPRQRARMPRPINRATILGARRRDTRLFINPHLSRPRVHRPRPAERQNTALPLGASQFKNCPSGTRARALFVRGRARTGGRLTSAARGRFAPRERGAASCRGCPGCGVTRGTSTAGVSCCIKAPTLTPRKRAPPRVGVFALQVRSLGSSRPLFLAPAPTARRAPSPPPAAARLLLTPPAARAYTRL